MKRVTNVGDRDKWMVSAVVAILLIVSSSTVLGQDWEKPDKPTLQNLVEKGYDAEGFLGSEVLKWVQSSTNSTHEIEYWSHLTTNNTGDLPFGESIFYAYPRYWNYVFVDSKNRLFTDSGGLFIWNGTYWRPVMMEGKQITRVREIVEDDFGNLWLGTRDGLIQLNSTLQFVNKYTIDNSNLKKNDINTLWVENDGSLWIGHRWDEQTGGGVTIFNEQVIDSLGSYTNDIIQRNNGDVWVAQAPDNQGNGGSIYVYRPSNDSSWTYTEDNSGLPHSEVDNFSEDGGGNIWMGHYATAHHPKGGVTKFDGTNWTHFDQSDGLPQGGAWYTYAASDDKIYYGTRDSMMVYEDGSWNHFTNNSSRFPLKGATIVTEDRNDNLIIGADPGADLTGGGIHTFDGTSWDFVSSYTDNGLSSNIIFGADVDTEGNLWFSGFYGVSMFDGQNWTYFNEHDGLARSYAWKILATSDGSVWFMTVSNGITQYKNGSFIVHDLDGVLSGNKTFEETAFEDSQGNIWFGAWDWKNRNKPGGILKYDGTNFTVYDDTDGLIGENVTAIGEGPDGKIYASTFAGLGVFDGSSWSEASVDGQTGVGVGELASDADNNLWLSMHDGTLKKWDGSTWKSFDSSDGYVGWATHIEPAADGSIWLTNSKVQVIRDGQVFDMTPPEYSGSIGYVITHDDKGATWVGTYGNGLFKYQMSEGLAIKSIEDYPDDQGGWVTLKAGGFLMDPYRIEDGEYESASWEVQRKNGDRWESAGTSSNFTGISNQMSVQVPTTMPTDEDTSAHKYVFRVGVFGSAGDILGYSDPDTAFALDNIAPTAVTGITATRGMDEVSMSWNVTDANDLYSYEIVSADAPNGTPIATTQHNSVSLSDTEHTGIQQLQVRARDIHSNVGTPSEKAIAVFPMKLDYQVQESWNLISLPLEVDAADLDAFLSEVPEGSVYEYNGSYDLVQTIEPGKGYWAKFSVADTYQVPGLPIAEQTLQLDAGWNLISGIGTDFELGQIQDPDNILIEGTLSGFDGSYTQTELLSPGNGYWVRTSESGTVTFNLLGNATSKSAKKEVSPLAEAKTQLNAITIRSSKGHTNTLYFGDGLPDRVNPKSFSLPPLPPGDVFDVRFAEDMRYVEGNTFTIQLQKDPASEITIEVKLLESDSYQAYRVKEVKGNTVLAEHTLSNSDSITLRNGEATALKFTPVTAREVAQNIPEKFKLSPSYPNPFNPSTTIQYELPQQVAVQLEVFNMVGQKVRTLIAGRQQEAGTHSIRFDASTLSSGMYLVRLQAGSFEQIQKITLIK